MNQPLKMLLQHKRQRRQRRKLRQPQLRNPPTPAITDLPTMQEQRRHQHAAPIPPSNGNQVKYPCPVCCSTCERSQAFG